MADERIEIEVVLDDGSIQTGFANIKKEAQKTEKSLSFGKVAKGLARFSAIAVTAGAAIAGVATKKGIDAARQQEDAINQLTTSLGKLGEASRLSELEDFAREIQQTTRFGDEATLSQLAFAQSMGASVDQSKEIVRAATDMSAALNIDFNSAVRNISKTLGGYAGELGEVIPELKNLTTEQLRSGAGVNLLAKQFQGFAQAEVKTFSGAVEQVSNSFGDFLEGIGDFFIQSPAFVKFINFLSSSFSSLADSLKSAGNTDFLAVALNNLIDFAQGYIRFVLTPLEVLFNFVTVVFKPAFTAVFDFIVDAVTSALNLITPVVEAVFGKIQTVLAETKEGIESTDLFANVFNTETADQLSANLEGFKQNTLIANQQIQQSNMETKESFDQVGESVFNTLGDSFKKLSEDSAKTFKVTSDSIRKSMITGIGNGAGQAFASFGKAVAEGENAIDAFINSLISSMGQMAIQLGTQFILQGVAYLWAGLPNGPNLIAAGAALAAFGGILSAVGGGTSDAGTSSPSTAVGTASTEADVLEPSVAAEETDELAAAQTGVTINVEGTVVDPKSTGETIAETLQEFFDASGGQLVVS